VFPSFYNNWATNCVFFFFPATVLQEGENKNITEQKKSITQYAAPIQLPKSKMEKKRFKTQSLLGGIIRIKGREGM
jgi:hypothetical protein